MNSNGINYDQALNRFGLASFRPGQREVIESIVRGDDCMCVMPTGGGKSLCYQLPSIVRPGLTIVVSPLIALMKDQVDRMGQLGIPAALINSTLTANEQQTRLQDVAAGKYQLVYVAPERLRNTKFMETIRATPIQLLAIDEAHCISQWGHDFRPDYTRIGKFREWLGGVQTVALTATATPRVREDIVQVLGLKRPKQFMSGFARPNLHFGVATCPSDREKESELENFLQTVKGSGIIYSATRKRCDALVEMINQKLKISVGAYHAGLMPDQRRAIQERFMEGKLRIIVATNAFGMGIDKSDLRFVVHYNMPGSLEAYYQEAGRAGRDGRKSQCVMLYSFQDRYIQEFFIDNNYPSREVIEKTYDFLLTREEDPIEMTLEEIRDALGLSISPEAIGSALQILGRTQVLERLEMGSGLAIVQIDSDLPSLVDLLPREAKVQRKVLRLLERAVGDRRSEPVHIHPRWLLQESELERDALNRALRGLGKLDAIDYVPPFRGRAVHFKRRDVAFNDLGIDFENLNKRKEAEYDRLNQVVSYAQTPLCRQTNILKYFGDDTAENCERCDRCGRSPGWPKVDWEPDEEESPTAKMSSGDAALAAAESPAAGEGSTQASSASLIPDSAKAIFLGQVVGAVERIHGRLGKHLLAQYLCGSQNAKVQKLNLHRLSGFGMLKNFRQADALSLLDSLIAAGLLKQQEVNRNRPTICVAPELSQPEQRRQLLLATSIPDGLHKKVLSLLPRDLGPKAGVVPAASAVPQAGESTARDASPPASAADLGPASTAGAGSGSQSNSNSSRPSAVAMGESLFPEMRLGAKSVELPPAGQSGSKSSDLQRSDLAGGLAKPGGLSGVAVGGSAQLPEDSHESGTEIAPAWYWTVRLFSLGFDWQAVLATRRMTDTEVSASLIEALKAGQRLERHWLSGTGEDLRTTGQQRVVREIQRREAAGIR
ncbi:RecQ family ATP-dependent DNA helicase [Aureliella helgolandensis]|uniref:ATP-dependent DNA helicase RecQ n=1 Tax=Aureliella helgolandensis TaxID=2527968 RepID=A0A518GGP1_9BACT|nr:ATP-dependent DNA helicase RecQ [Aureliella helgolandensis]QDV27743.1 ATP-dependent DNA helicase RecQ [Aureliella helgolandensis]